MSILIGLVICFLLNMAVSFIVSNLIPNYYLSTMITSIVIAFIYAILTLPRGHKATFFREKGFYLYFFVMGTVFLLMDWLIFTL